MLLLAAAALGILVFRNANPLKNVMLAPQPLPDAYYYGGNFSDSCTTLDVPLDLKYCEDAAFWDIFDNGALAIRNLILSCDPGRRAWNTVMGPLHDPAPRGRIWLHVPHTGDTQPIVFAGYPEGHDFHPLGLAIWPSYNHNASALYVVNHARHRTVIEHFLLSPAAPTVARHVRTISSPYFLSPNAIALTSPNALYVSNDHLMTRRLPIIGHVLPLLESVLALPFGFVLHVTLAPTSQSTPQAVALSLPFVPFANGVAISPDGTTFAVASCSLAHVRLYRRNPATNALVRRTHTIDLPFAVDNLHFANDGTLYATGHPDFPTLSKLVANKTDHSPSWAVAIPSLPNPNMAPLSEFDVDAITSMNGLVKGVPGMVTVFQSNGKGFSTSATTLKDDRTGVLYITGLYAEKGIMVCRPKA